MIPNEILNNILNNSYCFCFTRNKRRMEILNRFKIKLSELNISFNLIIGHEESSLILAKKNERTPFLFISKINDQKDYNTGQLLNIYPGLDKVNQYDTLLSCAYYDKNKFVAYNDYMGIIRHYYYYDNESFFASNNSFIAALLADGQISQEAIYETLFFRFPYKTGSYFQDVRSLDTFEYIEYDTLQNKLIIKRFKKPDKSADYYAGSLDEGVSEFWNRVKYLDGMVNVSYSGGSDSTTILSLLDKFNIYYKLVFLRVIMKKIQGEL